VIGHTESIFGAFAQAKPNSLINGVQIGTITYSYRSMPDQGAEATLKYILDSGISAIELMGNTAESFAGAPTSGRGGGAGRGAGGPGGPGGAPDAAPEGRGRRGRGPIDPANLPAGAKLGSWNGESCVIPAPPGERGGGAGGGGGRGRGEQTPEQQAAQQEAAAKLKAWRTSVSMDKFKQLRKMYTTPASASTPGSS
jgi:hypothetical protein